MGNEQQRKAGGSSPTYMCIKVESACYLKGSVNLFKGFLSRDVIKPFFYKITLEVDRKELKQ